MLFSLLSLISFPVFRTSAVSPIFSPILPSFRFVGENQVSGVVDQGGELRFFNKREASRLSKKKEMSGLFEKNKFKRNDLSQRGKPVTFERGRSGEIKEVLHKREKREASRGVGKDERLIKDPRCIHCSAKLSTPAFQSTTLLSAHTSQCNFNNLCNSAQITHIFYKTKIAKSSFQPKSFVIFLNMFYLSELRSEFLCGPMVVFLNIS